MNGLEPLVTVHAGTGAFRAITSDILAETYLAPRPQAIDLNAVLADGAFPWSASMGVAPLETAAALSAALRSLAVATHGLSPEEVDLGAIDRDSRLYKHLAALCDLWRQAPGALPEDLQVYAHVLTCAFGDALEPLPLVAGDPCGFATPIERRLHAQLLDHHGVADAAFQKEWAARRAPLMTGAAEGTSLWRAQQGLTGASIPSGPLDDSLAFFALRDEAEEADFAAARAQRLIDQGVSAHEIGLLVPDETGYVVQLRRAFDAAGVPISGLPVQPDLRDIAGETLLQLLLCFQAPAPAMALASLYISPLMPWSPETGLQLSREVMQGRFEPFAARSLTGRAQRFYQLVRSNIAQTPDGIQQALEQAAQLLSDAAEQREAVAAFRSKLGTMRAELAQSRSLDWTALYRVATPATPKPSSSVAFVEGVSVFMEGSMPWRSARHLIAMGMSGNRWPRAVSASPLFLDGELRLLREKTGLHIETRGDVLARRLEKLRRQFLCASESLTLLRPVFAPNGSRQAPAAALSVVARTIGNGEKGTEDAEALLHDFRALPRERWPFAHRVVEAAPDPQASALPEDGVLHLGRDLLRRRLADDGRMRPQSPSRLETLLVSPLAWSLSEFGAEPVTWAPDGLNVMVSGTIAHDVLEFLFPKDAPLPDNDQIEAAVPELLSAAIRKHAPFLQRSIWAVERDGLLRDIRTAAHAWRTTLEGLGARVIDNEINLQGEALGILLRGRADCLLQLPDGSLLVVDHKKSGTPKRRARLEAGWDLQLGLYREMLKRPERTGEVLEAALAGSPKIGVAYHLINDQGVLLEGLEPPDGVVTVVEGEISLQAMDLLITRLAEVGAGFIRLNNEDDRKFFEKTANLAPYALDTSPLIPRFMMPGAEAAASMEDIDD
jgi:RecB family exonuclease